MLTNGYSKSLALGGDVVVTLRPLRQDDRDALLRFFRSLPEEDRIFLRHDVCDPRVISTWTDHIDYSTIAPLVAWDDEEIVGEGTLHPATHGWMRHVADIRLVVAPSHRRMGLGAMIARELVALADSYGVEKIQAQVIEENIGGVKMFGTLGFIPAAVLKGMVKDRRGRQRNLVVMINDVSSLNRLMEEWIQNSMVPAYRVPGAEH